MGRHMAATMRKLLKDLSVLDLGSGKYGGLLNCIGATWDWKDKEGGEYEVTGQFAGSVRRGNWEMAEKCLTSCLKSHGLRMRDEAVELGLAVIVGDIEEYCGLAGIQLNEKSEETEETDRKRHAEFCAGMDQKQGVGPGHCKCMTKVEDRVRELLDELLKVVEELKALEGMREAGA